MKLRWKRFQLALQIRKAKAKNARRFDGRFLPFCIGRVRDEWISYKKEAYVKA